MLKSSIVVSIFILQICMDAVLGNIQNCNLYGNSSTETCASCLDKYCLSSDSRSCLPSTSGCLKCNASGVCSECIASSYLVVNTGQCQLCTLNCKKCDGNKCVECAQGYSVMNVNDTATCIKCSDDCIKCKSRDVCEQCSENFKLLEKSENGKTQKYCTTEEKKGVIETILISIGACFAACLGCLKGMAECKCDGCEGCEGCGECCRACCSVCEICCIRRGYGGHRSSMGQDVCLCCCVCCDGSDSTQSTAFSSQPNNIYQNQEVKRRQQEMMMTPPPSSGMYYGQSPQIDYGYN